MTTQEKLQQAFQTAVMLADQIAAIRREIENRPMPPEGRSCETKGMLCALSMIGETAFGVASKLGTIS